jgi:hypothetical protein
LASLAIYSLYLPHIRGNYAGLATKGFVEALP